ncbi:MAG: hypothetical protein KDK40_04695, partial [Chlamydiia bacterium]|nr:hypothetical protein [Chlamydiia bacterium]
MKKYAKPLAEHLNGLYGSKVFLENPWKTRLLDAAKIGTKSGLQVLDILLWARECSDALDKQPSSEPESKNIVHGMVEGTAKYAIDMTLGLVCDPIYSMVPQSELTPERIEKANKRLTPEKWSRLRRALDADRPSLSTDLTQKDYEDYAVLNAQAYKQVKESLISGLKSLADKVFAPLYKKHPQSRDTVHFAINDTANDVKDELTEGLSREKMQSYFQSPKKLEAFIESFSKSYNKKLETNIDKRHSEAEAIRTFTSPAEASTPTQEPNQPPASQPPSQRFDPQTIPALLFKYPALSNEETGKLISVYIDHTKRKPSIEERKTPEENKESSKLLIALLDRVVEQKIPLNADQQKTLAELCQKEVERDDELDAQKKAINNLNSEEKRAKIAQAVRNASVEVAHAIQATLQWKEQERQYNYQARRSYQSCCRMLEEMGCQISLDSLRGCSRDEIQTTIQRLLVVNHNKMATYLVEATEAYGKQVAQTRASIQSCIQKIGQMEREMDSLRAVRDTLNAHYKRKRDHVKKSRRFVMFLDTVYSAVGIAGGIVSVANPAVGASMVAAGQAGHTVTSFLQASTNRKLDHLNHKFQNRLDNISSRAQHLSRDFQLEQQLYNQLNHQAQAQVDFLLSHPEHFTLDGYRKSLVDSIAEVVKKIDAATSVKDQLENGKPRKKNQFFGSYQNQSLQQLKNDENSYKARYDNRREGNTKKDYLKDYEAAKTRREKREEAITTRNEELEELNKQREALKSQLEQAKKWAELPLHRRPFNTEHLTSTEIVACHLKYFSELSQRRTEEWSQWPTEMKCLYLNELCFHAPVKAKQIEEELTNHPQQANKTLVGAILDGFDLAHRVSGEHAIATELGSNLSAGIDLTKEPTKENAAKYDEFRNVEKAIGSLQSTLGTLDQQITHYFYQLSRLPQTERKEALETIYTEFKKRRAGNITEREKEQLDRMIWAAEDQKHHLILEESTRAYYRAQSDPDLRDAAFHTFLTSSEAKVDALKQELNRLEKQSERTALENERIGMIKDELFKENRSQNEMRIHNYSLELQDFQTNALGESGDETVREINHRHNEAMRLIRENQTFAQLSKLLGEVQTLMGISNRPKLAQSAAVAKNLSAITAEANYLYRYYQSLDKLKENLKTKSVVTALVTKGVGANIAGLALPAVGMLIGIATLIEMTKDHSAEIAEVNQKLAEEKRQRLRAKLVEFGDIVSQEITTTVFEPLAKMNIQELQELRGLRDQLTLVQKELSEMKRTLSRIEKNQENAALIDQKDRCQTARENFNQKTLKGRALLQSTSGTGWNDTQWIPEHLLASREFIKEAHCAPRNGADGGLQVGLDAAVEFPELFSAMCMHGAEKGNRPNLPLLLQGCELITEIAQKTSALSFAERTRLKVNEHKNVIQVALSEVKEAVKGVTSAIDLSLACEKASTALGECRKAIDERQTHNRAAVEPHQKELAEKWFVNHPLRDGGARAWAKSRFALYELVHGSASIQLSPAEFKELWKGIKVRESEITGPTGTVSGGTLFSLLGTWGAVIAL